MSRGSVGRTEEAIVSINLQDYPGIYWHLSDKRAVTQALSNPSSHEQAKKLFEHYQQAAEISRQKLQTTIAVGSPAKVTILESHGLYVQASVATVKLLQDEKRLRYFRGMQIYGDPLTLRLPMDLSGVDFGNCVFDCDVDFTGCDLRGANFQGAVFNKKLIVHDANLRRANFKDARVTELCTNIKTKCSGRFTSSWMQKNSITTIKRETYSLDEERAITLDTSDSAHKILIADREYDLRQFWENFKIEYNKLRTKGGFGDQIKQLEKLSLIKKISALFLHAQEDNNSRTLTALKILAQNFIAQTAAQQGHRIREDESDPLLLTKSVSEQTKIPLRRASIAQQTEGLIDAATSLVPSVQPPFASLTQDFETIRRVTEDCYQRESTQLSEAFQAESSAIMLRDGLQSIAAFESNAVTLLKKYEWLKAKNQDTRFVDVLLQDRIFPEILKHIIYPTASKVIPYKDLGDFFKKSIMSADCIKIITDAGLVFGGQNRLIAANKTSFIKECHAAWGKLSIAVLVSIDAIDKKIAAHIAEKMKTQGQLPEADRTCIERQYYLALLIQNGKYVEAEREADALRAAWPTYPFEADQQGIFSMLSDGIRTAVIKNVENSLRTSVLAEDEQKIQDHVYQNCQPIVVEEIFKKLIAPIDFDTIHRGLRLAYEKLFYFTAPMLGAIHVTRLIRRIAKKVLLHKQPIDQDDLKLLYSCVNSAFIWIGGESERQILIQMADRDDAVSGMMKQLLNHAMKADDLLKENAEPIIQASKIKEEHFKSLVNVLLDVPAIIDDLKTIFHPIWLQYEPIKRAVTKLPNGDLVFADPNALGTQALVNDPRVNIIKLKQAEALYAQFKNFESNILNCSYNFVGVRQVSVSCDVSGVRESYEKEAFVVPDLLPINQISVEIGDLRLALDNFLSELGDESTNTFGQKIKAASEKIRHRKKIWERHVTALIQLQDPVAKEQPKKMALSQ